MYGPYHRQCKLNYAPSFLIKLKIYVCSVLIQFAKFILYQWIYLEIIKADQCEKLQQKRAAAHRLSIDLKRCILTIC